MRAEPRWASTNESGAHWRKVVWGHTWYGDTEARADPRGGFQSEQDFLQVKPRLSKNNLILKKSKKMSGLQEVHPRAGLTEGESRLQRCCLHPALWRGGGAQRFLFLRQGWGQGGHQGPGRNTQNIAVNWSTSPIITTRSTYMWNRIMLYCLL